VKRGAAAYAHALYGLASERGATAEVASELERLTALLPAGARALLQHPAVAPQAASGILETLVRGASPLVANLLRVLADRRRMELLPDIAAAFRERADAAAGRVRARVQSARPLAAEELADLAAALGRRLHAEVQVTAEVRPDLIGGARVLVGDRVLDGSLEGQLAVLRRRLAAAR
jgi:F-type H+-transporting ATPase subunit delta